MKTLIILFLSLAWTLSFADEAKVILETKQWMESRPELSELGLPANPQTRAEFNLILNKNIELLSKLRSEYSGESKRRWMKWKGEETDRKLDAFTRYHSHLGEFLALVISRPTLVGLMNESRKNKQGVAIKLWSLWDEWRSQRYRTRQYRKEHQRFVALTHNRKPTMSDLVANQYLLEKVLAKSSLKEQILIRVKKFEDQKEELKILAKTLPGKMWFHALYGVKSSLLTFFGRMALPKKNTITPQKMNELQTKLVPGDIMVVNQDGRLSNVVFTGTWSHGILYVGTPNNLTNYFNDEETNAFYAAKCQELKLDCDSFEKYLQVKLKDETKEYFASRDDASPKLFIEAIDKGVIINSFDDMKPVNRVAAFGPRLSKLERARAIEIAFSNMGKAYDYNFDARTYDRLVCTELIMYAYLPEEQTGKKGLNFVVSIVKGIPAMYAYNIVEAYYSRDELDFRVYWESPSSGEELEERTPTQLEETI